MVTPLEETIKGQKSLFPYPKISSRDLSEQGRTQMGRSLGLRSTILSGRSSDPDRSADIVADSQ